MKNKVILSSVLLGGILASNLIGAQAFAAERSSMDTNTHIEFSGHTPNPTPNGELDLIWVPTTFEFGKHEVADNAAAATTYQMQNPLPKYTIVDDNRQTEHGAWNVTATASELKSGSETLSGAQINISNTSLKQYSSDDNTVVPETSGVITDAPGSWSNVSVEGTINLPADGTTSAAVMSATGDAVENGKYAAELGNVELTIPQNVAKEGNYTGTVTWTLADAL